MADIAFLGCRNVVSGFAWGQRAVMTAGAGTENLCMVNGSCWDKRCGVMTGLAHISRSDVSGGLANGDGAVMATNTVIGDSRMIECGIEKRSRVMTDIAFLCSHNMTSGLARCNCAVVTAGAGAQHFVVIDRVRWDKAIG